MFPRVGFVIHRLVQMYGSHANTSDENGKGHQRIVLVSINYGSFARGAEGSGRGFGSPSVSTIYGNCVIESDENERKLTHSSFITLKRHF